MFVGTGFAFCPHNDTFYLHSSNASATMHVHVCVSKDHVSGNVNINDDDLMMVGKSVIDAKGAWERCLGEVESVLCKFSQKLLMVDEKKQKDALRSRQIHERMSYLCHETC